MASSIQDPYIPFVGPIAGNRFTPGKVIRIQGVVPGVAYRFDVNLQCGAETLPRDDVALQVAVRILDGFIALNSLQNGIWGEELQGYTQPIKRAERFEMIIMCDFNKYKIAINGQPFFDFPQRIHYDCISHLTVEGDVSIIQISYESQSTVPSGPIPVTLRHTNNDFEIINTHKPIDGFSEPPSYSEVVHQYPTPNVPPYPTKNLQGMPQSVAYTSGIPSAPYPTSPSSFSSPVAPGVPLSPPTSAPIPLNAASSNFRPVNSQLKKSRMMKCCGYFWSVIIGIIIVIAVVISKTRSVKHYQTNNNHYSSSYGSSNYGSSSYDNNYNRYNN